MTEKKKKLVWGNGDEAHAPNVAAFIAELVDVCRKYQLTLNTDIGDDGFTVNHIPRRREEITADDCFGDCVISVDRNIPQELL